MRISSFFCKSSDIHRDSFVWNMIGSILNSFQSVIFLVVLTRTVSLEESGIFTIAFAYSNLFLTIGKYGMRNFQASDMNNDYSFREYLRSRVVTIAVMGISTITVISMVSATSEYSVRKMIIVIIICLYRIPDAIEDIYHGNLQQNGRLYIAAKALTVRMVISIASFCLALVVFRNQLIAIMISYVVTVMALIVIYMIVKGELNYTHKKKQEDTIIDLFHLFRDCLPLFIGSFLTIYITNSPKYAIDRLLSDEFQAIFGFIVMPVSAIGLLSGFIFNPIINSLSKEWLSENRKIFYQNVLIQIFSVISITAFCLILAWFWGTTVLSVLYNTDLSDYRTELMILLLGGGFSAMAALLNALVTVIRIQEWLSVGYILTAILAMLLSNRIVSKYGLIGASWLYTSLMIMITIVFTVIFIVGLRRKSKNYR